MEHLTRGPLWEDGAKRPGTCSKSSSNQTPSCRAKRAPLASTATHTPWSCCLSCPGSVSPCTLFGTAVGSLRAADKHPPHRCLTCQSPDLSAEGHLFQHTLNLVSPCDRQLAAGIPQQRSYAPQTHTCRWIVWARAAQMPTTRVEQACSTSASTEQAPALLRSPGPLTEPAEGPHGPGRPHITPMTTPGQAVGGPAGDGAAPGAPAEMEGGCAGMQHGSEDGTQPLPLGLPGAGTTGQATHPQHGSPRPRHLP